MGHRRGYVGCLACVLLLLSHAAMADRGGGGDEKGKGASSGEKEKVEERTISGMSVVGNNETPKSLVIVPWKTSEIGQETKLKSNLLNDGLAPVDRAVFMRELNFYKLANPK